MNEYIILFIIIGVIYLRFHLLNNNTTKNTTKNYIPSYEFIRLSILLLGFVIIPFYSYYNLKNYNFIVNNKVKIIGYLLWFVSVIILLDIYDKLGKNYSITLQIKENHKLITDGIYNYVRHPMYFVLVLMFLTQIIFLPNKVGIISMLSVTPIFLIQRITNEEKMLKIEFGKQYEEYMKNTKMLIPFIF
jgi:protein-S-isoprenylcysteine O-methyltransferase Ste14